MKWYWYLLGGAVALFLLAYGYDFYKQWGLLKTADPYTGSAELKQMRATFDSWKGDKRSAGRFVKLIRDSRRLPPVPPNASPDVVRLKTP